MAAISIVTRGMIGGGGVGGGDTIVVSDKPVIGATIEVKPKIRTTSSSLPTPGPAGRPVVVATFELKPVILEGKGPVTEGPATEPKILRAEDLRPVIVDTEEDDS